jgi:integrase/recombinase XerD
MLTLYRRHSVGKCKFTERTEKRCACPIWVTGTVAGKPVKRQALKTRMWGEAEREIELWQHHPTKREEKAVRSIPLEGTIAKYLTSCKAEKNIQDSTFASYKNTLEHLTKFMLAKGITRLSEIKVEHIREFVAERSENKPRTRRKELEHVRFLFNYCVENQWIGLNPAKAVKIKVPKGGTTMPFTDPEISTLLSACDKIDNPNKKFVLRARLRAKALILGMCYTGLRISDMITLKRLEVKQDGEVKDHVIIKTKRVLWTQFGELALAALLAVPLEGEYFFWSGKSKLTTATGSARRTFYSLQRATGIKIHPHRFRDTFALKVLEERGDIRELQFLLGHSSVKTTEEYYAHLGTKHQERLRTALSSISYTH